MQRTLVPFMPRSQPRPFCTCRGFLGATNINPPSQKIVQLFLRATINIGIVSAAVTVVDEAGLVVV